VAAPVLVVGALLVADDDDNSSDDNSNVAGIGSFYCIMTFCVVLTDCRVSTVIDEHWASHWKKGLVGFCDTNRF